MRRADHDLDLGRGLLQALRSVAAQVQTEGGFRVGERRSLFSVSERYLNAQTNYASWDVAPDDQRFLMLQIGGDDSEANRLIIVQTFFQELEARVQR